MPVTTLCAPDDLAVDPRLRETERNNLIQASGNPNINVQFADNPGRYLQNILCPGSSFNADPAQQPRFFVYPERCEGNPSSIRFNRKVEV
jgi:hypothetical protein